MFWPSRAGGACKLRGLAGRLNQWQSKIISRAYTSLEFVPMACNLHKVHFRDVRCVHKVVSSWCGQFVHALRILRLSSAAQERRQQHSSTAAGPYWKHQRNTN
jgi:hypothetical protein